MRVVYFTLAFMIVLNIGAACRTPSTLPAGCEALNGGLVHCAEPGADSYG